MTGQRRFMQCLPCAADRALCCGGVGHFAPRPVNRCRLKKLKSSRIIYFYWDKYLQMHRESSSVRCRCQTFCSSSKELCHQARRFLELNIDHWVREEFRRSLFLKVTKKTARIFILPDDDSVGDWSPGVSIYQAHAFVILLRSLQVFHFFDCYIVFYHCI